MIVPVNERQTVHVHTRYSDGVIESLAILDPVKREIVKIIERGPRVGIFNPSPRTSGYQDSGEKLDVSYFTDGKVRMIDIANHRSELLTTIILNEKQDVVHCMRHANIISASDMADAQPLRGAGGTSPVTPQQPKRPVDPARNARVQRIIDNMLRPAGDS